MSLVTSTKFGNSAPQRLAAMALIANEAGEAVLAGLRRSQVLIRAAGGWSRSMCDLSVAESAPAVFMIIFSSE